MELNEEYKIRYDIVLKELLTKFDDEFETIELEQESNDEETEWINNEETNEYILAGNNVIQNEIDSVSEVIQEVAKDAKNQIDVSVNNSMNVLNEINDYVNQYVKPMNNEEDLKRWCNGNIELKLNTELDDLDSTVHDETLLTSPKKSITWIQFICSFFSCKK
jgi:predicted CopG family antitoxin